LLTQQEASTTNCYCSITHITGIRTHKDLPQCCEELWGLQVQCTLEENGGQGVADTYITGYMIPFTEEKRDVDEEIIKANRYWLHGTEWLAH